MSDEAFTDRVLDGVNGLDGTAHRKAVALGTEAPALRDGLQVPSSRMVLMPALGALWAAGLGMEKPGWSRLARQGLLAIALGTVAGKGIKRVVCRARPNEGRDPSRWGKADGKHASFPSGHAINVSALTMAVGLNRGLSPATMASLGFAAAVGWSSLATERHWASDYAAGMATGVLAGLAAKALDGWAEDRLS
ncbi:phosphatase PAP2 family protein [Azospirillum formosense]|nr:phosphatase PAP2 family protein [Azospirillum formosense]MBY3751811.1 phosphatase PAP2 family protein [Azospirillum formosense]